MKYSTSVSSVGFRTELTDFMTNLKSPQKTGLLGGGIYLQMQPTKKDVLPPLDLVRDHFYMPLQNLTMHNSIQFAIFFGHDYNLP